jgi:hypothetical protein
MTTKMDTRTSSMIAAEKDEVRYPSWPKLDIHSAKCII